QPAAAGGKAGRGSGRRGRTRHDSGGPGLDTDIGRARLRTCRDRAVRLAAVAPVRLARRLCHDLRPGGRPPDPAADHHVPAPADAVRRGLGGTRRAGLVCLRLRAPDGRLRRNFAATPGGMADYAELIIGAAEAVAAPQCALMRSITASEAISFEAISFGG